MYRSRVGLDAQKPGIARDIYKARFRRCHENKLAEINSRAPGTGTLDNTRPYTAGLAHLKTRPKKKALLAARDAEVERENRQLLRQMTKIYVTPASSTLPGFHDASEGRGSGGGGVRKSTGCPSINALCRKRELERIAMENMHLVKHLRRVSSTYDTASWERDRKLNRQVMQRLRTVKYERRRLGPEEFGRLGVKLLRKEVDRTKGQAFEPGSTPVPRLRGPPIQQTKNRRYRSCTGTGIRRHHLARGVPVRGSSKRCRDSFASGSTKVNRRFVQEDDTGRSRASRSSPTPPSLLRTRSEPSGSTSKATATRRTTREKTRPVVENAMTTDGTVGTLPLGTSGTHETTTEEAFASGGARNPRRASTAPCQRDSMRQRRQQSSSEREIIADATMGLAVGGNLRRRPSQGKNDDDTPEDSATEDGDSLARPNENSASVDPHGEEKAISKLAQQPRGDIPQLPGGAAGDEPPGEKHALEHPDGKPGIGEEDAQDKQPQLPEEDGKKYDEDGDVKNHVDAIDDEDVYSEFGTDHEEDRGGTKSSTDDDHKGHQAAPNHRNDDAKGMDPKDEIPPTVEVRVRKALQGSSNSTGGAGSKDEDEDEYSEFDASDMEGDDALSSCGYGSGDFEPEESSRSEHPEGPPSAALGKEAQEPSEKPPDPDADPKTSLQMSSR